MIRADVRSVPSRLVRPSRWMEPWALLHHDVGGGDYRRVGGSIFDLLTRHAGLQAGERVLDIGCGAGGWPGGWRRSWAGPERAYIGFDVSARAVGYCRKRIGAGRPDFAFLHLDCRNPAYNPAGRIAPTAARFPAPDGWADLAFAASVFTHMDAESVGRYMAETARALRPGGRFLFTAYALDEHSLSELEAGVARMAFTPWGAAGSRVSDARCPELAIAHPAALLERLGAESGLTLEAAVPGSWRGTWPEKERECFQDVLVLGKRRVGAAS